MTPHNFGAVGGPTASAPALVGRQRELGLLRSHFQAAAGGQARIVLVTGEPGIGKTRLLEEVADRAARHGAVVLRGGASEAEGMPPYLPFLEALGQHIRTADPDQLCEQTGAAANTLATILPELTVRLGELPESYPLPADQARLRLYEAVGVFLAAIAAPLPTPKGDFRFEISDLRLQDHPIENLKSEISNPISVETEGGLVLILDDLHWAGTASLDLLCHIARHRPEARLLILGAYREGEAEQNSALQRALAELTRQRKLTTITLGPLLPEDVAALTSNYLGGTADPALSQFLYVHSEGNPFFAEELLRGWLETGAVVPQGDWWTIDVPVASTLPPSIVGAIRQRLARLSTDIVDQLRIAAIIGRTFDARLLAHVRGHDVEALEALLLVAERVRLVRDDGTGTFTFSHDKIRECLYSEVSSTRRRRLHEAIGRTLEASADEPAPQPLAALAFHFARSGDRARGAAYSRCAGEAALGAYAPAEAATHYQTALDLLPADDDERGELLLRLGEAALMAGAECEAAVAYAAAQSWFEQAGDLVRMARAARGRGLTQLRSDAFPEAEESLEQALALLDAAGRLGPETVRILVDLAHLVGLTLGRQAEGIAYGQRALELASRLGDERLEATASWGVGFLLLLENDIPAGVSLLERALALATAHDDLAQASECCSGLAQAYCLLAEIERCREVSWRREELARRCQQPYRLRYAYAWLAFLDAAQGAWSQAEEMLALARPTAEGLTTAGPLAFVHQMHGFLAYQRGDYELAEREFQAAAATFQHQDPPQFVLCVGPLALSLLAGGKGQAARAFAAEHEPHLDSLSASRLPVAMTLGCLALMAVALSEREQAASYYPRLVAHQGQFHWFLVDRILGEIATLCDDWPAAATHLAAAAATAQQEGLRPELARTLTAQAGLELTQGGRGSARRARRLLGQALRVFRELDMAGEARRTRERLRSLPRQPGARAHPPLPAGLTLREAEVLRLVAAGKTNREIAQELFLSENTVAKHLTSIFNKTATENRAAAAAFAIRHDLA